MLNERNDAAIEANGEDRVADIERLALGAEDILVVRSKQPLSDAQCDRITEMMRRVVGDRKVLVLDADLEISVLEATEGLHAKFDRLLELLTAGDDLGEVAQTLDGDLQARERNPLDPL